MSKKRKAFDTRNSRTIKVGFNESQHIIRYLVMLAGSVPTNKKTKNGYVCFLPGSFFCVRCHHAW